MIRKIHHNNLIILNEKLMLFIKNNNYWKKIKLSGIFILLGIYFLKDNILNYNGFN